MCFEEKKQKSGAVTGCLISCITVVQCGCVFLCVCHRLTTVLSMQYTWMGIFTPQSKFCVENSWSAPSPFLTFITRLKEPFCLWFMNYSWGYQKIWQPTDWQLKLQLYYDLESSFISVVMEKKNNNKTPPHAYFDDMTLCISLILSRKSFPHLFIYKAKDIPLRYVELRWYTK